MILMPLVFFSMLFGMTCTVITVVTPDQEVKQFEVHHTWR
jgi:hypothetical protein